MADQGVRFTPRQTVRFTPRSGAQPTRQVMRLDEPPNPYGSEEFAGPVAARAAAEMIGYGSDESQARMQAEDPNIAMSGARPEFGDLPVGSDPLSDPKYLEFKKMQQEQDVMHPTAKNVGTGLGVVASLNPLKAGMNVAKRLKNVGADIIEDVTMQGAMGVNKFERGMGTRMAEQGLWRGIPGVASKQIEKKLPTLSREVDQIAATRPETISGPRVGRQLLDKQERFLTPGGKTTEAGQESIDLIQKRAAEAAEQGQMPVSEALGRKKILGTEGWRADKPLPGLQKELARSEGGILKKEVLESIEDPKVRQQVADLLANQEALYKAKRGIERPTDILSLIGLLRGAGKLTSPVLSTVGQAAHGARKLTGTAADKLADYLTGQYTSGAYDTESLRKNPR